MTGKVCIGNITGGSHAIGFNKGLLECYAPGQTLVGGHIIQEAPPYLDMYRNIVIQRFLMDESYAACDWLLFIDSDVFFSPEDIARLRASADPGLAPAVSGVYYGFSAEYGVHPIIYRWGHKEFRWVDGSEGSGQRFIPLTPEESLEVGSPVTGLTTCDAYGAGFLLLHRDLLTKMGETYPRPTPWFAQPGFTPEGESDPIHMGEDMGFCLRLAEMGVPVVFNPDVRLRHLKPILLDANATRKESS